MGSSKTHPHIDRPSEQQMVEILANRPPELRQTHLDVHRLVLDVVPDVVYSTDCVDGETGYGARQYGYDGWGMLALQAHTKWVSLYFLRGAALEDDEGLFEGTGRVMRHVRLRSSEEFERHRGTLRRLIEAAAMLNVK